MFLLSHRVSETVVGRQASDIFMSALHDVYDEFRFVYQVPFPHVTIRQMKSRWGSCRPDLGKITLNLLLVTASYEDLRCSGTS